MHHLLPFFQWCQDTALGNGIRNSEWWFPVIEAFHLLALAVLGGAILVVDLRVCGLGLKRLAPADIAKDVQPWMLGSLAVMLVSGTLLFLSEAMKCYDNVPFRLKIGFLLTAILFTLTVRSRVVRDITDVTHAISGRAKAISIASLLLWFGVGAMGRGIAFY